MTQTSTERGLKVIPRERNTVDLSSYTFGKIPPQARDLEEAVLGACMLESNAIAFVIDILKPESFYVDAHTHVFRAIQNLFNKSAPVDILTVTDELKRIGKLEDVGGPFAVTDLTSRIASGANVEHHARIIAQKYIQRELIRISSDIIKSSYEDSTDVFVLLDQAEQGLFGVVDRNLRTGYATSNDLVARSIKRMEFTRANPGILMGVPSGFTELDRVTGGWRKANLIILAGRPGMGKTSFMIALARNAAVDYRNPIALFSLEMTSDELTEKLQAYESDIELDRVQGKGDLLPEEALHLMKSSERIADAPIFIDDTAAINIFELRAKCRRLKMQHDVKLFIVDYLQLMAATEKKGNREQEISEISRSLKSIAKELDTPVIAISQLSRAVETRGGSKRPQLSDLRESGAIEQDADLVIFLYRPEYYQLELTEDNQPARGLAEIIIAKHRNGALRTVNTQFIDKYAKFIDQPMNSSHKQANPRTEEFPI